jgi:hypothetical protein
MKALVECLIDWLQEERSTAKAWRILDTLARETLKTANSQDSEQREFEVLDIAQACEPHVQRDHDSAKAWFSGGKPANFLAGRRAKLDEFFSKAGHQQALELAKSESKGGNKTVWFLKAYDLQRAEISNPCDQKVVIEELPSRPGATAPDITYDVTKPGDIQLSWLGRLVLGNGAFKTKSGRGVLWAAWMLTTGIFILACGYLSFSMRGVNRPLQTNDLVMLLALMAVGWIAWRVVLRPLIWLLEDRLILAAEALMKLKEDSAQLDMAKDDAHRYIRLVRYSAVCPICAGNIELRYGHGANHRRIFGCCSEVPTEHVYTFDRITRIGQRYRS